MGNGNKVEMLIAVCAVLTSVIALFVAWDQGRVMRAQQHGAVYPVLQADGYVSADGDIRRMGVRFRNSGVGPALIESVEFFKDEERLDSLVAYRNRLPGEYNLSWTSMIGRAVGPGDEISALEISWPGGAISFEERAAVTTEWGELSMKVCYCSVFGRCWNAWGLATNTPSEHVKSCVRSAQDPFEEMSATLAATRRDDPEVE